MKGEKYFKDNEITFNQVPRDGRDQFKAWINGAWEIETVRDILMAAYKSLMTLTKSKEVSAN